MKHNFLDWIGCGASAVLTAVQTNQIFQTISLILTCIATLVTIGYNIYRWYKKATEDKKITPKALIKSKHYQKMIKEKINNVKIRQQGN